MIEQKRSISVMVAVGVLAAAGITSWGNPTEPVINYHWAAPVSGTAVASYSLQAEVDGVVTDWPEPIIGEAFTWPAYPYGQTLRVRVAGVDSLGRQGPWSEWSDGWIDNGPPGEAGQPQQTLGLK